MCLEISRRGAPSPNPYVGAVVVKNGKIISTGYHKKAGMPHAEIEALEGVDAEGSTLYVSLEPCSHFGRTPPCTSAIIDAKVKRVVWGADDPTEKVSGREALEEAGIEVVSGVLERECRKLNEVFFKYSETGLPYVVLKSASTLDGQIATSTGESKWITCNESRRRSHILRGMYDAILVGAETVLVDDPRLSERTGLGKDPVKIVLDSNLRICENARIFNEGETIVATTKSCNQKKAEVIGGKAEVVVFDGERVGLISLLSYLGERGISSVLVEGGCDVYTQFYESGLVDKYVFFIAPKIMGGANKPIFNGEKIENITDARELILDCVERLGDDMMAVYYPKEHG
jgi:diaminohydroxyphosphoribosylaminopyrimidine deaminase / 5-amino-6-(5-phosphoribosylamino)uracil reductase